MCTRSRAVPKLFLVSNPTSATRLPHSEFSTSLYSIWQVKQTFSRRQEGGEERASANMLIGLRNNSTFVGKLPKKGGINV